MTFEFDPLPTAVRVFTTRTRRSRRRPDKPVNKPMRRYPHEVLVFDTETTTDPAQRFHVGVWRLYRDDLDGAPGETCIEEGLIYPDDLPHWDPDGYARLVEYAANHTPNVLPGFAPVGSAGSLPLLPLSRWLEQRLYLYGFGHRDRCDIVGFNLLFDLARVASYWAAGRNNFLGGWKLGLFGSFDHRGKWKDAKYHPSLSAKAIDPRRTLFAWGNVKDDNDAHLRKHKGRFVDLRTLAFALTDRSHSLESACKAFGIPFKKAPVKYGVISEELLDYAREDVAHTARLYRACLDELDRHPGVDLPAHRLYSPATVGTRYLQAMGLERPMAKFHLDPEIHGHAMSAFYGGRAEARIVRTPVPVAYVDATSMYPTVNALLATWKLLTADTIQPVDATEEVRDLLADPNLYERCFHRDYWSQHIGVTLVQLDHPDGAILPIRAEYDDTARNLGIGLNPLRYQGTIWYTLPDVIASTILTRNPPPVAKATRLNPVGNQAGLRPVRLRGGETIDPAVDDPFHKLIELRHRTRNDLSIPEVERKRLDRFLKITANATAYGVLARYDRRRFSKPKAVTVYGPDQPFDTQTTTPEDPGPYCFPPIAATITAAARLLLAMLERAVTDAGGTWAFCDTDSMAIVCSPDPSPIPCPTPDGTDQLHPLTPNTVRAILDRFHPLNPYDPSLIPDLWGPEHDSLDQPVWAYVISAKRYVLYRPAPDGTPTLISVSEDEDDGSDDPEEGLVDWSEHGLGAYMNPLPSDDVNDEDEDPRPEWIRQAWEWILTGGTRVDLPGWADAYALTRFSLSSPSITPWFDGYNRTRPRHHQIRPATFGLLAHPDPLLYGGRDNPPRPATTYQTQPELWYQLDWYDRTTGNQVRVTTAEPRDPDFLRHLAEGHIRIRTLGDVVVDFSRRPEHKSLAPDGTRATGDTRGLLRRRPIESAPVLTDLIGKEGNDLAERGSGLTKDPDAYRNTYGHRGDRWQALVLPILRDLGAVEVMRRTGRGRSTVYEVLSGKEVKYSGPATRYAQVAVEEVQARLLEVGERVPKNPNGALYRASQMSRMRSGA